MPLPPAESPSFALFDAAGCLLDWNDAFALEFADAAGLLGRGVEADAILAACLLPALALDLSWVPKGAPPPPLRYVHAGAVIVVCQERTGRGGVLRFAQRASEEALRQERASAEVASGAKASFIANMSHEIRTPMNAVMGLLQLVLGTPLEPSQEALLRKAHTSAKAMLRLLNDILDYSKIEAGRLVLEARPMPVAAVVGDVAALFASRIEEKGLSFSVDVAPDVPAVVTGDALRLTQVLNNLVGNAIKFTTRGGIALRVGVAGRSDDQVTLRFCLRDTGIGLSPEQLGRLFQPFSQADSSITRKYGGTGLGLAISQQLVGLMGGSIQAASVEGQGASFCFTVQVGCSEGPASRGAELVEVVTRAGGAPPGARFRGACVLLAEDDAINQLVARAQLTRLGVSVTTANDGHEAVAWAARQPFDLVLMDLQMPGLDGLEAAQQIRALPGRAWLPIIALTASVMREDRERCAAAGLVDFLAKPVDGDELAEVLGRWLPRSRSSPPTSRTPAAAYTSACATTPVAPPALDAAGLGRLAQLRDYLERRELVPDELLVDVLPLARLGGPGSAAARLLEQLDRFDHVGALASLTELVASPVEAAP